MRALRWISPVLLLAGAALVALAIARGGASLYLVVFVPIVTGASVEFLAGVVLLLAGFFLLPSIVVGAAPGGPVAPERPTSLTGGGGGLVLFGPVPILFGSYRSVSPRVRWWLSIVGAILLVAFAASVWLAVR